MTMEEMKAVLGVESKPTVHEVERGAIRRFADAVGDPNPLYRDPDAARDAGYADVIAPPTYLRALTAGPRAPAVPAPVPGRARRRQRLALPEAGAGRTAHNGNLEAGRREGARRTPRPHGHSNHRD